MTQKLNNGKTVKKIALLGGGRSNFALIEIFKKFYPESKVILRDEGASGAIAGFDEVYTGKHAFLNISEDVLLLSPSVRRERTEIQAAISRGAYVTSDAEYFFQNTTKPVFAITGSDGKSTVTYLTSMLLKKSGFSEPGGNFGLPLCTLLNKEISGVVCELSSFQLSYITPKLWRATVTNISENHLNWHNGYEEYINAKENCIRGALWRVLPLWCEICRERFIPRYKSDVILAEERSEGELLHLGASHTIIRRKNKIYVDGVAILDIREMKRRESFTVKNFMSAIGMALGYASEEDIHSLACSFGGLKHRCELVATYGGIDFINSSIDTTPKRAGTTIEALGSGSLVILTGLGKGLSYTPLITALNKYAKAVIICGKNADTIYKGLSEVSVPVYIKDEFDEAVIFAAEIARAGERVLLSPAHTSFDTFVNYEQRGERFSEIINKYINVNS